MKFQIPFLCLLFLSSLFGCKEGTIIYEDIEFPRADSDEHKGEVVEVVLVPLLREEQLEHLEQTQELLGQLFLMDKEVLLELTQVVVAEVVAEQVVVEVEMVVLE